MRSCHLFPPAIRARSADRERARDAAQVPGRAAAERGASGAAWSGAAHAARARGGVRGARAEVA